MVSATETTMAREMLREGPRFGLLTATFVVVSSMIGTGVLTTSGFTVYFVGSNQLMLVLWVVGGVLALCGALTLCELSAALPRSGGDYVFLYEAYGPLAAFLSGWVSFLIGFGGPIAASASAAAKYLLAPLRLDDASAAVAQPAVASAAIVALGVIHCLGRGSTIRAQGGMTALKIGILAMLAIAGLVAGWGRWEYLDDRPPLSPGLLVTMASSLVYISYAYTGWNAASYLAGEVDRPQKQMPRAILLGTSLVLAPLPCTEHGLRLGPVGRRRPGVGRRPRQCQRDRADRPDRHRSALWPSRRRPAVSSHWADIAGLGERLYLDRATGCLRDGPRWPIPRSRRPGVGPGRTRDRDGPSGRLVADLALDCIVRAHLALLGRRPGDLFDVNGQRHLRPSSAPARSAAAVSYARLSDRAGHLPSRDRPLNRGRLLRAADCLVILSVQHCPRRARVLLPDRHRCTTPYNLMT